MPLSAFEAEPDPLGRLQRQRINIAGASNTGASSVSQHSSTPTNMMVPGLASGNLDVALRPTQTGNKIDCEKHARCSGAIVFVCLASSRE